MHGGALVLLYVCLVALLLLMFVGHLGKAISITDHVAGVGTSARTYN